MPRMDYTVSDLSIEAQAEIAALPQPWPSFLKLIEAQGRLHDAMRLRLGDLAQEQKRMYEEQAELRDELHLLSLALVSAGIPLVDPPPLRSVS